MLPFKVDGMPSQQSGKDNDTVHCGWCNLGWKKAKQHSQRIMGNAGIEGL